MHASLLKRAPKKLHYTASPQMMVESEAGLCQYCPSASRYWCDCITQLQSGTEIPFSFLFVFLNARIRQGLGASYAVANERSVTLLFLGFGGTRDDPCRPPAELRQNLGRSRNFPQLSAPT